MAAATLIYGAAVAWFTNTFFRIGSLIYQFETFPRTYGSAVDISLGDLARLALARGEDLPAFRIVVPAFQESIVIEATLQRLAAANYPRSRFEVWVVTYEDEPAIAGLETTGEIARRAAARINDEAGRVLARVLSVPAAYDGYFPGSQGGRPPQIGKPRGLNFALRTLHEDNEANERILYLHLMDVRGWQARANAALDALTATMGAGDAGTIDAFVARCFEPAGDGFIGAFARSAQLRRALTLAQGLLAGGHAGAGKALLRLVDEEAPRFFLRLDGAGRLSVVPEQAFLHDCLHTLEALDAPSIARRGETRARVLQREQPLAWARIAAAADALALWQQVRRSGARWLLVYDADADAPTDLMRHLAASVLADASVMGFQGPVAPVANLEAVHPLCALGGLWMAFWHATYYPRLMGKPHWAHPLAGTNWCFRIDGFARDGRLVHDDAGREVDRRFLLSFDPEQLTEDLEAGVRIFNDWQVNAEWHPHVELEQVPPTPRALVVQRTRWTLGTLQTVRYIVGSRLPRLQRLRFALHPVEILASGSGPVVTLLLWAMILSGALLPHTSFQFWTVLLTLGNLAYVLSFQRTYRRFERHAHDAAAVRWLRGPGRALARRVQAALPQGRLDAPARQALGSLAARLERGLDQRGFIARHLQGRCLDDEPAASDRSPAAELTRAWRAETPTRLERDELPALVRQWRALADDAARAAVPAGATLPGLAAELQALAELQREQWRRGLRMRGRIWLWTFPYLFFQLLPYFKGLAIWVSGRPRTAWRKTPRTPKAVAGGDGHEFGR